MKKVSLQEATAQLPELYDLASAGEEVWILQDGKPAMKLVPVEETAAPRTTAEAAERRLGFMRGEMMIPDDFDHMMEDEIAEMFYSGPLFPEE